MRNIGFEEVKNNETVNIYIAEADKTLNALGYTEHGFAHVTLCAEKASEILKTLGKDEHLCELAKIAGYMHDMGNAINREDHAQSGAMMAFTLLNSMQMPPKDIATVITAIGNHDEGSAYPVNEVSAALILADKSDVRRSRVNQVNEIEFDIHDRVNYAVEDSVINIDKENKKFILSITINTEICPIMDYFEIFLDRMLLCRKAAELLDLNFKLNINGVELL